MPPRPVEEELQLLASVHRPLREREEERLVDALAELLVEWLEQQRRARSGASAFLDSPGPKEER